MSDIRTTDLPIAPEIASEDTMLANVGDVPVTSQVPLRRAASGFPAYSTAIISPWDSTGRMGAVFRLIRDQYKNDSSTVTSAAGTIRPSAGVFLDSYFGAVGLPTFA